MPTAVKADGETEVVKDFKQWLQNNDKGQAVAVGAINALTNLAERSDASTIMELEIVLKGGGLGIARAGGGQGSPRLCSGRKAGSKGQAARSGS